MQNSNKTVQISDDETFEHQVGMKCDREKKKKKEGMSRGREVVSGVEEERMLFLDGGLGGGGNVLALRLKVPLDLILR